MIYKSYLIEKDINLIKSNIVLFYGVNIGLKNDFQINIKNKNKDAEIINLYQDEILKNEDLLLKEILNISLFTKKKVFFLNQTNDKFLNLIKEIEAKVDGQKIYLFADILEKKSKLRSYFEKSKSLGVVPCYEDNEITLKKIAQQDLDNFKGLSSQILNVILDNSGGNRVRLKNELNKIKSFFYDKILDEEKLKILLNIKINEDFNVLKDKAIVGDRISTNKLLNETVIDTDKNIMYLNSINQRLLKLLQLSALIKETSLDNAIHNLKPPVFWKDKTTLTNQVRKWDNEKIRKALDQTYILEIQLKSNSTINSNILIKKLLVDICNLANS